MDKNANIEDLNLLGEHTYTIKEENTTNKGNEGRTNCGFLVVKYPTGIHC